MDPQDPLAQLKAQYADSVREAQSALTQLSASVFNRPQLHDRVHSSPPFQRWLSCRERASALEQRIRQMGEQGAVAAQCDG